MAVMAAELGCEPRELYADRNPLDSAEVYLAKCAPCRIAIRRIKAVAKIDSPPSRTFVLAATTRLIVTLHCPYRQQSRNAFMREIASIGECGSSLRRVVPSIQA